MLDIDKKDQRPLRMVVYDELKMRILTGQIAAGERMMEEETSRDLGVSRTPVREAFKRLEKEGLVIIKPRRGAFATQMAKKDLMEILDVRESLESMAAGQACERMTKAQKEKLRSVCEKHKKGVANNTYKQMVKYDTEFHQLLVEGSRNKTLINFVEQLQELVLRFRYIYYDKTESAANVAAEHGNILDAILEGDVDKTIAETKKHIIGLKDIVRDFDL